MPQKLKDISNQKFGLLTAKKYIGNEKWECHCDCGQIVYATGTSLRNGKRTNCGCSRKTRLIDLSGKRFGKLTVISKSDIRKSNKVYWNCLCDCGKETIVCGSNLGRMVNSCGCIKSDRITKIKTIHGQRSTKLYAVWCSMKSRCNNKNAKSYKDYGARGINVCEEWLNSFESFYEWSMKNGYKEGLQIDRINNNGDYCPENCRWITRKENMNNTSKNVFLDYNGDIKTLSQWSDIVGTSEKLISGRLKRGWSAEQALFGKKNT